MRFPLSELLAKGVLSVFSHAVVFTHVDDGLSLHNHEAAKVLSD